MASTVADSLRFQAKMTWQQSQANESGSFAATLQGPDKLDFSLSPNAATYTEVLLDKFTLAAAASQTVSFRSFANFLNTTVTITKLKGVFIKATATLTGGQLRIAPGASNDLPWPLAGTTPTLTLDVGIDGCLLLLVNGIAVTVSSTDATWDVSNPGSQAITVYIGAMLGGVSLRPLRATA